LLVLCKQLVAHFILLLNNFVDFGIDHFASLFGIRLLESIFSRIVNGAERVNHAVVADDALCDLGALLDIIGGASRNPFEEDLFRYATAECHCDHVTELVLGVE